MGSIYLVGQLSEQASRRSFGEPAQKAGIVLRASARQSLGTQANEFDLRLPLGGVWRFAQVRLRLSPASRRRRSRRPIRTSTRTYPPNESLFIGVFFRGDFRRFRAVSLNLLPLTARWRKQQRQPMTMNMGDKWPRHPIKSREMFEQVPPGCRAWSQRGRRQVAACCGGRYATTNVNSSRKIWIHFSKCYI